MRRQSAPSHASTRPGKDEAGGHSPRDAVEPRGGRAPGALAGCECRSFSQEGVTRGKWGDPEQNVRHVPGKTSNSPLQKSIQESPAVQCGTASPSRGAHAIRSTRRPTAFPASALPRGRRCTGRAVAASPDRALASPPHDDASVRAARTALSRGTPPTDRFLPPQTRGLPRPGATAVRYRARARRCSLFSGDSGRALMQQRSRPTPRASGRLSLLAPAWAWPPWPVRPGSPRRLASATRRGLDGTVAAAGRTPSSRPAAPTGVREAPARRSRPARDAPRGSHGAPPAGGGALRGQDVRPPAPCAERSGGVTGPDGPARRGVATPAPGREDAGQDAACRPRDPSRVGQG